jgi:Tfp pilus assembly protein PilN
MSVLTTQNEQLVGTGLASLPRVNLLPPEIEELRRFRRIQVGLGGGVAAAVGLVALLLVAANGSVASANTELEAAAGEQSRLQAETAKYADVQAVYAQAAAAEVMLTQAMGEEIRYSRFLSDLSLTVPENVWLKSLTFTQAEVPAAAVGTTEPAIASVTVSGVGFSHGDVAVWLESLAGQQGYTNPYFSSSTESRIGTRTVVDFSSSAELTSEALSGQYTKPAGG